MTFTVEFGWWILPTVITVVCFGFAAFCSRDLGNDQFGAGAVIAMGFYLMALVGSLATWLIWSLVA